ncbi:hypothetical protein VDGD_21511 [Verticillium dahliae]|nr:hypothetical protein VDGD_21511 [Verticillium dahliae]
MLPNLQKPAVFYKSHTYSDTSDRTTPAIGGMDVSNTVMVPNKLMLRLDSAAARGSVLSSTAVAIADELAPSVTPLVT